MPLTRRYQPPHPPGETASFGMDFSPILPEGIAITSATLAIFTNTNPPIPADADWSKGTVYTRGRAAFAVLGQGVSGKDYQLQWTATDSRANVWVRTAMVLCSSTS